MLGFLEHEAKIYTEPIKWVTTLGLVKSMVITVPLNPIVKPRIKTTARETDHQHHQFWADSGVVMRHIAPLATQLVCI